MKAGRILTLTPILVFIISFIIIGICFYSNTNCSNYLSDYYWCQHFTPVEITIIDYSGFKAIGKYNNISCNFRNNIGYIPICRTNRWILSNRKSVYLFDRLE